MLAVPSARRFTTRLGAVQCPLPALEQIQDSDRTPRDVPVGYSDAVERRDGEHGRMHTVRNTAPGEAAALPAS
jgi:hypothetical protein